MNKVDDNASSDCCILSFNFHHISFENWFHCIPIRKHLIFSKSTFEHVLGIWKFIISLLFFLVTSILWEKLLKSFPRMLVRSMYSCISHFNGYLEWLTAFSTENISLCSIHLLQNSGVSDNTIFLVFFLIPLS